MEGAVSRGVYTLVPGKPVKVLCETNSAGPQVRVLTDKRECAQKEKAPPKGRKRIRGEGVPLY